MKPKLNLQKSYDLLDRAKQVIPDGVLGVRKPSFHLDHEYPVFMAWAKGGRVGDVDGNEYVDMLLGLGPILIGHGEPEIDEPVSQMMKAGFCFSLTHQIQVELAELLRDIIPCAEMSVFVKTGSDATTCAIRTARAYTGRDKVIRCGYHGWHDWCIKFKGGIPAKLYEDVFEFAYNDLDSLESLLKVHGDQTAAIIVTPLEHERDLPVSEPEKGFLAGVKALAEKYGAVLIFDEIRTGFRYSLGGAQAYYGVTPHLATIGKAMSNGYAIAALVGQKEYMQPANTVAYISATFFSDPLAQLAAFKTITFLKMHQVPEKLRETGNAFGRRAQGVIRESGLPLRFSGAPYMPYVTPHSGNDDLDEKLRTTFYTSLIRNRVFMGGPHHHGYIAYRHEARDFDLVIAAMAEAVEDVKAIIA